MAISEPNTILEINDSHVDNFILVIPKLPVSDYVTSLFNDIIHPNNTTPGTTGTSGTTEICNDINEQQLRREKNLDATNFRLYVSGVQLPGTTIGKIDVHTQFATMARAGKISFTDLVTTVRVSENFLNYNIMLYWMYALHNPLEYNKLFGREMINEFFTDIHLILLNNHKEKLAEYKFIDAFPINIPPVGFTYQNADKIVMDINWAHSGMVPENNYVLKYV